MKTISAILSLVILLTIANTLHGQVIKYHGDNVTSIFIESSAGVYSIEKKTQYYTQDRLLLRHHAQSNTWKYQSRVQSNITNNIALKRTKEKVVTRKKPAERVDSNAVLKLATGLSGTKFSGTLNDFITKEEFDNYFTRDRAIAIIKRAGKQRLKARKRRLKWYSPEKYERYRMYYSNEELDSAVITLRDSTMFLNYILPKIDTNGFNIIADAWAETNINLILTSGDTVTFRGGFTNPLFQPFTKLKGDTTSFGFINILNLKINAALLLILPENFQNNYYLKAESVLYNYFKCGLDKKLDLFFDECFEYL